MSIERNQAFWQAVNPNLHELSGIAINGDLWATTYLIVNWYAADTSQNEGRLLCSAAIADGFVPQGGIAMAHINRDSLEDSTMEYAQAFYRPQGVFESKVKAYEKSQQKSTTESLNEQWSELPLASRLQAAYDRYCEAFLLMCYYADTTYCGSVSGNGTRFVFSAAKKPEIIIMLDGDKFYSDDVDQLGVDHFRDGILDWLDTVWYPRAIDSSMALIEYASTISKESTDNARTA